MSRDLSGLLPAALAVLMLGAASLAGCSNGNDPQPTQMQPGGGPKAGPGQASSAPGVPAPATSAPSG